VVMEDDKVKVSGTTSAANNYSIYFEVAQESTGVDVMQNFELNFISTYMPSTMDSLFNNTIDSNTDTTMTGTFSGIVINGDNGQLSLTSGMINITY